MSDQLLGVIIGAGIGFAGTALITLFQWRMEKEKRREERLWQYRQEHLRSIRPIWERVHRCLYEYVKVSERVYAVVDGGLLAQQEGTWHEFCDEVIPVALESIGASLSRLEELQLDDSELLALGTIHDPHLREAMRKGLSDLHGALAFLRSDVDSYYKKCLDGYEPASAEKLVETLKRFAEARGGVVQVIRDIESSIERYVTQP